MADLMSYLPHYYQDIHEFKVLMAIENPEFNLLLSEFDGVLNDQFILTAQEPAIEKREKLFNILADPKTETMEFRRKRIINRQSIKPPFTLKYLQQRLDFLLGEGVATARVDVTNYILRVELAITNAALFKEVLEMIEKIVPLNIIYLQKTALENRLCLKEHIIARKIKRSIRLSTNWRLGIIPFGSLSSEVVVK
ncbi:putative phage tail protein [Psychrobacillus sp.]|uniref:putative phage tail protein n=1 Tax=Psychrobacillus sp. TaxID=1871623 RepID=UPI0028BE06E4|nr:putative phage tail protein [Psychrobacillus sp.]